ncbi:ABC-2 transporter permease [Olsenella profusa]|uniref:ABC-2 transporter permease n=1 Tax=Olsenella profusa TaxID=138595 RepID=A0ABS2F0S6_9ACTN|nr:ABC-2 transporter permease [Olsenella profusa]MBM6774579.1 ABC-2 transporter permease [Olsenella profusa]
MKRAYLIEMTIFRDYARQLLGLGLLVSLCIGLGMQTPLAMPATLTCMFFMMGSMGLAAYDELNHWGLFRLTLPLSRRDVVLGRYGAIVTLGLMGMVVGLAGALVAVAVVSALGIGGEVGEAFSFGADLLGPMAFVTSFCLLIGAVVASVVTPIYFRLGQTRATQILPTVIVLLFVVPVAVLGNSGMLDGGIPGLDLVSGVLAALETPGGMVAGVAACVALSAAALAVSAAISLKLYERREL